MCQSPAPSALLLKLRSATDALHRATETHPLMQDLLSGQAERGAYARLLAALYPFYARAEADAAIAAWCAQHYPPFVSQKRTTLIERALGHGSQAPFPLHSNEPLCADESEAIGALYVMEGATLGGKQIAKQLRLHYGLRIEPGASLFDPYGKACAANWQAFHRAVRQCEAFIAADAAIRAAKEHFERFGACLDHAQCT